MAFAADKKALRGFAEKRGLAGRQAIFQCLARNLKRSVRILASVRFALHTSLLEGVNDTIKVIKRMA